MDELKPCPFCGGEAETWCQPGKHGLFVFVKCDICGAQTRVRSAEDFDDDDEFWAQPAVIHVKKLWNSRIS